MFRLTSTYMCLLERTNANACVRKQVSLPCPIWVVTTQSVRFCSSGFLSHLYLIWGPALREVDCRVWSISWCLGIWETVRKLSHHSALPLRHRVSFCRVQVPLVLSSKDNWEPVCEPLDTVSFGDTRAGWSSPAESDWSLEVAVVKQVQTVPRPEFVHH